MQDSSFTNVLTGYDSFNPGRFFDEHQLVPYSLRLDEFTGEYQLDIVNGKTQPLDFTAELSTRTQDGEWEPAILKVNSPLEVGGTKVYLLGNGYAPVITVRDPDGVPVYSGAIPFLPQDANLTSLGVVKVPDGLAEQLGIIGFFYPDPVQLDTGAYASLTPYSGDDSLLTLTVYQGDLGLDTRRAGQRLQPRHRRARADRGPRRRRRRARTHAGRDRRAAERARVDRVHRAAALRQPRHPPRPHRGLGARRSR